MAAGLGFKDFTTGEVLTAGDVDGYLMQGIWVFASAAARDAAVTSPQEGNFAFTKDTNGLWYYDGAAWVASGATGDIEGVTAGIGISGGGTSGTVTVTNSMATAIDAKGDLVVGTGADTFAKLTVGANGTTLVADSAEATGLKWATPASGGGMTLLSTTSLSGSSVTISSIDQTYTNLFITIYQVATAANDAGIRIAPNGVTNIASNQAINDAVSQNLYAGTYLKLYANLYPPSSSTSANSVYGLTINNYSASHRKSFIAYGTYHTTAYNQTAFYSMGGLDYTTAISSLEISLTTSTFSSGTVLVYGVK
jgi:hypothetical protein